MYWPLRQSPESGQRTTSNIWTGTARDPKKNYVRSKRCTALRGSATASWGIRRETTSEPLGIRLTLRTSEGVDGRRRDERQQCDDREKRENESLHF